MDKLLEKLDAIQKDQAALKQQLKDVEAKSSATVKAAVEEAISKDLVEAGAVSLEAKSKRKQSDWTGKGGFEHAKHLEASNIVMGKAFRALEDNDVSKAKALLTEGKDMCNSRITDCILADRYGWDVVNLAKGQGVVSIDDEKKLRKLARELEADKEKKKEKEKEKARAAGGWNRSSSRSQGGGGRDSRPHSYPSRSHSDRGRDHDYRDYDGDRYGDRDRDRDRDRHRDRGRPFSGGRRGR